ncbi:hypothetical protein FACS1894163_13360 [Spirochaetia bacterium]|nr:hypothetical protein FACS1894163_13360 [Spirochaetia bacterium]
MEKVEEKHKNINKTLEGILEVMKKPENKFQNALTLAGAA